MKNLKKFNEINEAGAGWKFYIGERSNPQLKKPYYKAYGQLSKADVKRKEDSVYGSMTLTPYDTKAEYDAALVKLKEDGFRIYESNTINESYESYEFSEEVEGYDDAIILNMSNDEGRVDKVKWIRSLAASVGCDANYARDISSASSSFLIVITGELAKFKKKFLKFNDFITEGKSEIMSIEAAAKKAGIQGTDNLSVIIEPAAEKLLSKSGAKSIRALDGKTISDFGKWAEGREFWVASDGSISYKTLQSFPEEGIAPFGLTVFTATKISKTN